MVSKNLKQAALFAAAEALDIRAAEGEETSLQESNWTCVANPAEAYVASLARIGWRALSASKVLEHQGHVWGFLSMAPGSLCVAAVVGYHCSAFAV